MRNATSRYSNAGRHLMVELAVPNPQAYAEHKRERWRPRRNDWNHNYHEDTYRHEPRRRSDRDRTTTRYSRTTRRSTSNESDDTTTEDDTPERYGLVTRSTNNQQRKRPRRIRRKRKNPKERSHNDAHNAYNARRTRAQENIAVLEPQWRYRQRLHELMANGVPPDQAPDFCEEEEEYTTSTNEADHYANMEYTQPTDGPYDSTDDDYAPSTPEPYDDIDDYSDDDPTYIRRGLDTNYVHNPLHTYGTPSATRRNEELPETEPDRRAEASLSNSPSDTNELRNKMTPPEAISDDTEPIHEEDELTTTKNDPTPLQRGITDATTNPPSPVTVKRAGTEIWIHGVRPTIEDPSVQAARTITHVLRHNADLFAKDDLDLGETHLMEFPIDTGSSLPIRQKATTLTNKKKKILQEIADKMLDAGIVSPSISPWANPAVLIEPTTPDGQWRLMVDYRKLNNVTKNITRALPDIDELIQHFAGSTVMSLIDLKCGYWQIPIAENDRPKTAMITQTALYEFNKVPYGVANAPAMFGELMQNVLRGLQPAYCFTHLEMVIVYSKTLTDHGQHLKNVFDRIRRAGLKIKLAGCRFCCPAIELLGHRLSPDGVKISPSSTKAILQLDQPTTAKTTRAFITMCSFYRRHIPDFVKMTRPLVEACKKNIKFEWTEECQRSFEQLKRTLATAPMIPYPRQEDGYHMVLHTDASIEAIGAILAQQDPNGEEQVLQYHNEMLPDEMKNHTISEIECYAIVRAVTKFKHYLSTKPFTIFTDHAPLLSIRTTKMHNDRIQKWAMILAGYPMDIKYKPGPLQKADFLSRIPANGDPDPAQPAETMEYQFLPEIRSLQNQPESSYDRKLRCLAEDICGTCNHRIGEDIPDEKEWTTDILYCLTSPNYDPLPRLCERCENHRQMDITTPNGECSTTCSPLDSPEWDTAFDINHAIVEPTEDPMEDDTEPYLENVDEDYYKDEWSDLFTLRPSPPHSPRGVRESYASEAQDKSMRKEDKKEDDTRTRKLNKEGYIPFVYAMDHDSTPEDDEEEALMRTPSTAKSAASMETRKRPIVSTHLSLRRKRRTRWT